MLWFWQIDRCWGSREEGRHAKEVSGKIVRESSAHARFLPLRRCSFCILLPVLAQFSLPSFSLATVHLRVLSAQEGHLKVSSQPFAPRLGAETLRTPFPLPSGEPRPSAIVICDLRLTGVCLPALRTNNSTWIRRFCSGSAHNSWRFQISAITIDGWALRNDPSTTETQPIKPVYHAISLFVVRPD
jgi:hypothetical protein